MQQERSQIENFVTKLKDVEAQGCDQTKSDKWKKHFPLSFCIEKEGGYSIAIEGESLSIMFPNGTKKHLFFSSETWNLYSFSLADKNIKWHISRIAETLQLDVNRIKMSESNPLFGICLRSGYDDSYDNLIFDVKASLKTETAVEYDEAYAINVHPPQAFCVQDQRAKIATHYLLAHKDKNWNLFFGFKKLFRRMHTNGVDEKLIIEFNQDESSAANGTNFMTIMQNMSPFANYSVSDGDTVTQYKVTSLAEPPTSNSTNVDPFGK